MALNMEGLAEMMLELEAKVPHRIVQRDEMFERVSPACTT